MPYTLRLLPALDCTPCAVFYQHASGMEEGGCGPLGAGVGEGGGRTVGRQERPALKYAETLQVCGAIKPCRNVGWHGRCATDHLQMNSLGDARGGSHDKAGTEKRCDSIMIMSVRMT